jgi:hypothetical protein
MMAGEDYPIYRHKSPECVGPVSPVILIRGEETNVTQQLA